MTLFAVPPIVVPLILNVAVQLPDEQIVVVDVIVPANGELSQILYVMLSGNENSPPIPSTQT